MRIMYTLAAYLVLHIFVLTSYIPTPKLTEAVKLLAASQWFVPTLLLVLLAPMVQKFLRPMFRVHFWTVVGLIAVFGCVVLQLLKIPGLWWSWSTMGLLILIVITIANVTKDRLGNTNSMLLGVMVMFLAIACWETLYQTGLLLYHDFFGSGTVCYWIVIAEQLTWIIPALIVILVLYRRYGSIVCVSKATLICASITVILNAIWFVGGMEIPLLWYQGPEGIVGPIVNVMAEPYMISVSRGSQSFWCVGIASLFIGRNK